MSPPPFHVFSCEGKFFALGTTRCCPFEIDRACYELLKAIESGLARLEELERDSDPAVGELLAEAREAGLLHAASMDIPADSRRRIGSRLRESWRIGPIQATFQLTNSCNLRCRYCYVEEFNDRRMSIETAVQALRWLVESGRNRTFQKLAFFGGEPLLEFVTMQDVVRYWRSIQGEYPQALHFAVTTNATLIDDRIAEWLLGEGVSVTVSYDGSESHARERVFANGRSSLSETLRGMEILRKTGVVFSVRATVTRGTDLDRLISEVKELCPGGGLTLSNATTSYAQGKSVPPSMGESPVDLNRKNVELCLEAHRQVTSCSKIGAAGMLQEIRSDQLGRALGTPEAHIFQQSYSKVTQRTILSCCGAADSVFGVSPEGTLFPCHRFVGLNDSNHALGSIQTGIDRNRALAWFERFELGSEDCADCWAVYLCGRGCYWEKAAANGTFRPLPDQTCKDYRTMYEQMIWLASEIGAPSSEE